jgi:hypothetical protein
MIIVTRMEQNHYQLYSKVNSSLTETPRHIYDSVIRVLRVGAARQDIVVELIAY